MRFRRGESFRFEFEHPLNATFRVIEVNGVGKMTHPAQAEIKNLSPHGIKLLTSLNMQLANVETIKAEIHFSMNENNPLVVKGIFVWQKEELKGYSYGIEIESTEDGEKKIIEELKKFSRGTVYVKRKN